jgi:hypothetical protein
MSISGEKRARNREAVRRYRRSTKGKATRRAYTQTEVYKAYMRERRMVYVAAHPDRHRARNRVYQAIKDGRLVRPDTCEHCGATGVPIEASHDEYTYDKALDVEWLCRSCHRRKDGTSSAFTP